MRKLTKKQQVIIDNLDPRCEDCAHYKLHKGKYMCFRMLPFLAYKVTQRLRPANGKSFNCGIEGTRFVAK